MNMETKYLHISRRIAQAVFIVFFLLMPVFDILRYDTTTHELFLLGAPWSLGLKSDVLLDHSAGGAAGVAFQFFLKAILPWITVLSIFPLLGFIFGRTFCGWLCPEGALFELMDFFSLKILGRRSIYGRQHNDPAVAGENRYLYAGLALIVLLTIPPLTGIMLTGFLIAPKTVWSQVLAGHLSPGVKAGIIGVTIYMFITSVLVRHSFCKYVCAAGLMQTLFGWISPVSLRLRFDRLNIANCTDCRGCEKTCFMGVRPRQARRDINCLNCGECIAACGQELAEGNLLGYALGSGEPRRSSGAISDNNSKEDYNGRCAGFKEADQIST